MRHIESIYRFTKGFSSASLWIYLEIFNRLLLNYKIYFKLARRAIIPFKSWTHFQIAMKKNDRNKANTTNKFQFNWAIESNEMKPRIELIIWKSLGAVWYTKLIRRERERERVSFVATMMTKSTANKVKIICVFIFFSQLLRREMKS